MTARMSTDGRGMRHGTVWYRTVWRRTLAVAAVLAMTFALAPQQPGRAVEEPLPDPSEVPSDPADVPDWAEHEAKKNLPPVWAARKHSLTENYSDVLAPNSDAGASNHLHDVTFPTAEVGYAHGVASKGFLLKTVNGGETWAQAAAPVKDGGGARLSFPTAEVGYVPGDTDLRRTTDGGASFEVLLSHLEVDGQFVFVTEDLGWVQVFNGSLSQHPRFPHGSRLLLMTTDGGGTWEVRSAYSGNTDEVAHTEIAGLVSHDQGATWERKSGGPDGDGRYPQIPTSQDPQLQVVGDTVDDAVLYLTDEGNPGHDHPAAMYRSDDAGANWETLAFTAPALTTPGDQEEIDREFVRIRSTHAVDAETVFVVGTVRTESPHDDAGLAWGLATGQIPERPVVARTTDGGDEWEDVTPALAPEGFLPRDVAFLPDPDPDPDSDDLVGHVVGGLRGQDRFDLQSYPVAFTTTNGRADEVVWTPEPVDLTAFAAERRPNTGSGAMDLNGVAAIRHEDDQGRVEVRSVAVGRNWAIVQRTNNPGEWPPDSQDACLPLGLVQAADGGEEDGQVAGQVEGVEKTVQDTADTDQSVLCDPMEKAAQEAADEPAFTPVPPGTCDVDRPEVGNSPDDPDAPFPCVGQVQLKDENNSDASFSTDLMLDRALGRVVAVSDSQAGATRVAMFDPEAMVQRGVDGFGEGFGGNSAWGHRTGVVNLAEVDAAIPDRLQAGRKAALMPVDPDAGRHDLALVGCGPRQGGNDCMPASIVTVSLTGQYIPKVAHTFEQIQIDGQPHAPTEVVHQTYDRANRILYALTEYNPLAAVPFGSTWQSAGEPQTVLHAFDADPEDADPGELDKMWSAQIDSACKTARHADFKAMGVSPDGRALVFGCEGFDFPHWGWVAFTPHGFMRVALPQGTDPRELTQADTSGIGQRFYSLPAKLGGGKSGDMRMEVDSATGLAFWIAPLSVARVFDFAGDRWIGSFQATGPDGSSAELGAVAADPNTGRLYPAAHPSQMMLAETVNLPVSVRRPVDLASEAYGNRVFDPDLRRLVTTGGDGTVRVFEDRIPPAQHLGVEDPDAATNDIDESEAATVRRDGQARGYGSRVWWTGLRTASPGVDPATSRGDSYGQIGSWGWLFSPEGEPVQDCNTSTTFAVTQTLCHGYFTTRVPGMVSSTQREATFGRVSTAELVASSDERESEAVAASQGVDDDTQGDVRRRRLLSEWRRYVDDTVLGPWDDDDGDQFDEGRDQMFGHDGWREFERCADEGVDRLWRELDGERRVSPPVDEDGNQPEDCFAQFDEDDPRGEDRSSLMEDTGAVAASRCHDENTGNDRARKARGSEVDCDAAGERTEASAELGGFTLRTPEGHEPAGWLTVGSSTSDSTLERDADRGIVVESSAAARDIEMGMAGQGTVRIGEVRSVARSWAKGRPDTADSSLDVAYEDVRITDADGRTRYSCGRAEQGDPVTPDAGFHHDDDEVDGEHGACDPHAVAEAINLVLGNRVQATTPARDTADKVAGSPGGARAIVRRDPAAYWSDVVVNNVSRWEIPALEVTFFNDSAVGPNRLKLGLAGVFTEANYVVGDPLGSYDSGGGTGDGDTNTDPGPATVTVELTDTDGTPLADGRFGLTDHTGAPTGTCTTDTSGTCDITGLPAGDYQVSQQSAPTGYLPATDTAPLTLAAGGHATVTFANVWAAGGVTILLTDPAEEPLAGGAFELLVGDGDGNATVFDTCTTGDDGTCAFPDVPLGDVAVRQTATPDGYQPAEPVVFALTSPGQVARLHVINGPAGAGTSGTRGQVVDDPMPQTERISLASSQPEFTGGTQPEVAEPDGLLGRALVLPGQVARFALRNPGQALLFTLVWLLVGAPLYLAVRRRELNHIKQWS